MAEVKAGDQGSVEVIIPCHSSERPLNRAVLSALRANPGGKVTVVAHNLPEAQLRAVLDDDVAEKVNWLEHWDGENSPAGPFMRGFGESTSDWVVRLDSDDYLEEGAIDTWTRLSLDADAVIARESFDTGAVIRTPPVRPFRRGKRDPVLDRLYYRSAPLGLLRRSFLVEHGLGLDLGVRTGEDLRMSSLSWSRGDVRVQRSGPGYVVGTDSGDRITEVPHPLKDDFEPIVRAWERGWTRELSPNERTALATKFLRIHIFGSAFTRALSRHWLPGDREALREATVAILEAAPSSEEPLSRADRALLDAILDANAPNYTVEELAKKRREFGRFNTLLPRRLRYFFHREAPLRFMIASMLVR